MQNVHFINIQSHFPMTLTHSAYWIQLDFKKKWKREQCLQDQKENHEKVAREVALLLSDPPKSGVRKSIWNNTLIENTDFTYMTFKK